MNQILSDKELFDLHSNDYADNFNKKQKRQRLLRLSKLFQLEKTYKLVDLACGSGLILPLIYNRIEEYVGVDFSPDFIRIAENNKNKLSISNASFICNDIVNFCNLYDNYFDVALAIDFSEHVYDQKWVNILKAVRFSLKKQGILYIHTPNSEYILEVLKSKNIFLKQFPEHVAVRSMENNCKLLLDAGFKISSTRYLAHYNVMGYLHILSFLPVIGKWFKSRIFIEAKNA
jgi:cyclopropane fatty-acyl-phospholipid synthase-like methyltransferase